MTAFIETGHARNLAQLHQLIIFCTNLGATYAPASSALSLTALSNIYTDGQAKLADVIAKKTAYSMAVNQRIESFAHLRKKSTRMLNALRASGTSVETINDAKEYQRKIQGNRASKPPTNTDPNAPVPKTISTSQQSFDQLIQHFAGLIAILDITPSYNPNEADLKIAQLNTYKNELIAHNTAVINAHAAVSTARIARDKLLYTQTESAYVRFMETKAYIRSIFGTNSPEYKQISSLSFKRLNA